MATQVHAFSRADAIKFYVDSSLNDLILIIREYGLDPTKLADSRAFWANVLTELLEDENLVELAIEFNKPGTSSITARWDFPAKYTGTGAVHDMWRDTEYLRSLIRKSARPKPGDEYRIIATLKSSAPMPAGLVSTDFKSTNGLTAVNAGTVIATGHLTAASTYWRVA